MLKKKKRKKNKKKSLWSYFSINNGSVDADQMLQPTPMAYTATAVVAVAAVAVAAAVVVVAAQELHLLFTQTEQRRRRRIRSKKKREEKKKGISQPDLSLFVAQIDAILSSSFHRSMMIISTISTLAGIVISLYNQSILSEIKSQIKMAEWKPRRTLDATSLRFWRFSLIFGIFSSFAN